MDRLVTREHRAEQDDKDDKDACQVFGPTEAIGKCLRWFSPRENEREPQRNSGRGVPNIVDHVGQQRHRPRDQNDDKLKCGRDRENYERPFNGPDATIAIRQRGIDHPMRVAMTSGSVIGVAGVAGFRIPDFARRRRASRECLS